ncbi:MAG TPA: type II toxin-antitoxin system VapC family toxin [Candidatus Eisenbacteria bacterium]|nr:type II toxin-antitoxin system VapC family toxin [Candidatus Eisenbacteria bacterium]
MNVYADSSLFVALYLPEAHSGEALRRIGEGKRIWLTPLHRVEWSQAIAQHVFRRIISSEQATKVYSAFEANRKSNMLVEANVPEEAFERAVQLAREYGPQMGMRTLDTLHIASALELGAKEFWSFDERQKGLAKTVGLSTS